VIVTPNNQKSKITRIRNGIIYLDTSVSVWFGSKLIDLYVAPILVNSTVSRTMEATIVPTLVPTIIPTGISTQPTAPTKSMSVGYSTVPTSIVRKPIPTVSDEIQKPVVTLIPTIIPKPTVYKPKLKDSTNLFIIKNARFIKKIGFGFLIKNISENAADINLDGEINADDYSILENFLVGKISLEDSQFEMADINKDGIVNTVDLTLLRKLI